MHEIFLLTLLSIFLLGYAVAYDRFDDGRGSVLADANGDLPVFLVGNPIWIRSGAPLGPRR